MKKLLTVGLVATLFTLVIGGWFGPRPKPNPGYTPYGGVCDQPGCDRA